MIIDVIWGVRGAEIQLDTVIQSKDNKLFNYLSKVKAIIITLTLEYYTLT